MSSARKSILLQGLALAGGLACALLVVAVLQGGTLPFTPPTLPGYVAHDAEGITVYAPSAAVARQGWQEVSEARERFREGFGSRTPPLVVVLVDDPAEFGRLKVEPLRRGGARLLPFVTPAHLDSRGGTSEILVLDDGSVLQVVDGAVQVVGRTATTRPAIVDIRAGDVVHALDGVPAAGLDQLAARYRAIPVGQTVRLDLLRERRPVSLAYPRTEGDTAAERAYWAEFRPLTQVNPLAHEACHVFVTALVEHASAMPGQTGAGYGHPALPDWLDEAAATQCESTTSRDVRRRHFSARFEDRIPLRQFTRMDHPLAQPLIVNVEEASSARSGYAVKVSVDEQSRTQVRSTGAVLFYSQALSLGEFLTRRGGPGVLQSLAQSLARGRTLDQALANAHPQSPALPATVDALEAEWVRWVEAGGGT